MNNQNYVYSELDPSFVNVPRDQNLLPVTYQDNSVASLHYGSHNYMPGGNLFPSEDNHSAIKPFHEDMVASHHQLASNNLSALTSKGPEPMCSGLEMNMGKLNPVMYSLHHQSPDPPSHNIQNFCPKFSSSSILSDPSQCYADSLQPAQHEPFMGSVSQPQEFPHQYGSREVISQGDVYLSRSSTSNDIASLSGQSSVPSTGVFSTDRIDCNQSSGAYSEVIDATEQNTCINQTIAIQPPFSQNLLTGQSEFPDVNLEPYPAPTVQDHVTTSCEEAPRQLEFNVGFPCSSQQEAEKLTQDCDPNRQIKASVSENVDKSPSGIISKYPLDTLSTSDTSAGETCSTTAQSRFADDVSSSLCQPSSVESSANSDNSCSVMTPTCQLSLDVDSVSKAQEGSVPSSQRRVQMSEIVTVTSGSNVEDNTGASETGLHKESLKSKIFTTEMELNGPEKCVENQSFNEKSKLAEEITADSSEQTDNRPLSPMIKVLNDIFDDESSISEEPLNGNAKKPQAHSSNYVRCTRTRTGTLPNKTRRFVDEFLSTADDESSLDSIPNEDWEYEEGAELAPSKADSFVTVSEKVLQVTPDELNYYIRQFPDGVEGVLKMRIHCTSCGKHMGAAPNKIHLGNRHKVLRVLICNRCRGFYGLGKFPRDSDGSEFYCRWCGQGGKVVCCSNCPNVFCELCIKRNFGSLELNKISNSTDWTCYVCNYEEVWIHRALCWAVLTYTAQKKKEALESRDPKKLLDLEQDCSKCCGTVTKRKKLRTSSKKGRPEIAPNDRPLPSHQDASDSDSIHFGHFLFGNESLPLHQEGPIEEDDFIDPSQFVQSVLQEDSPIRKPRGNPSMLQPPALRGHLQPVAPRLRGAQLRTPQPTAFTSAPRIVIRQGNLMQPGLTPFNKQPNSIAVRSNIARNPAPNVRSTPLLRNPVNVLNNVDGVRSMDQMQSLEIVPWFRDGLDNIRAVGFAITKRIRELEARFHSLKNKHDVEKVIKLGKKLERLSSKTESRFKQINSSMKVASKSWFIERMGGNQDQAHPFSRYQDNVSDWDDDLELSRPLEKVLVPISSASLQPGSVRRSIHKNSIPPPLVRTAVPVPPMVPLQRLTPPPLQPIRMTAGPAVPGQGHLQHQMQTVFRNNQVSVRPVRLLGPKSYIARHQIMVNSVRPVAINSMNVEKVNTLLNQRNGSHKISVSISSPTKRIRLESNSSDDSDVVVCPTIPELLARHGIKPCRVRLERNDDFISFFLENQEKNRQQNIGGFDNPLSLSEPDGNCEPHLLQGTQTVAAGSNADNYCVEDPKEPYNTLEEDIINIPRNESPLSYHSAIDHEKEDDKFLDEGNCPGSKQGNKSVKDVTSTAVQNIAAAILEDERSAAAKDVEGAAFEDKTGVAIEDVSAAAVEDATAVSTGDEDDVEIINDTSQSDN